MASPAPIKNTTFLACGLLFAVAIALYLLMLPLHSGDMDYFLLPWYETIERNGVAALSGEYSNYSPPYLYLLFLASFFSDFLPSVVLVKSVPIAFTVFSALVFSLIIFESTKNRQRALIAAFAFPLIPSVAANAAWWGQSDSIYTSLLLCAFLFSLRKKPYCVVLFFTLAFAVKAQSAFFLPYLLFLLFKKEVPWKAILLIPVMYVAMMFPAWLAGRSALELARIYLEQGNYYKELSMYAPNPWALVERFTDVTYETGVVAGILLAVAANLVLVLRALQIRDEDRSVRLFLVAAVLLISPYLLPKMHERYFYPADVFLAMLAFIHPQCRYAALSIQAASLAVTLAYLCGDTAAQEATSLVACLFSTYAIVELFRLTGRNYRVSGALFHRAAPQKPLQAQDMPGAG